MFKLAEIPLSQTPLVPKIVHDLWKEEELNFNKSTNRNLLVSSLQAQYDGLQTDKKVKENISSLLSENTYTVTTGHQLCLFGGPAYFVYKIISAIKTAQLYLEKYPTKKFVPIFWLASEDHDFEEVNHLFLFGKKIEWNRITEGAVGRMNTEGLSEVAQHLKEQLGEKEIVAFFEEAIKEKNLSKCTRYWINKLFGKYGLIIIDADDKALKKSFSTIIEKEFAENIGEKEVKKTNALLSSNYKLQVNPRALNFFHLRENSRVRFADEDWQQLLKEHPENFSPNVIFRPVYQEFILPNVAYVGGPNELAYWFQLSGLFSALSLSFPQLLLRDSFLILNAKQQKTINHFNYTFTDLFKSTEQLKKEFVELRLSIDFEKYHKQTVALFDAMKNEIKTVDNTMQSLVDAEKTKTLKSLENILSKLKKAEKTKHEVDLNKIEKLKNQLFPNGVFQEREISFLEFYSLSPTDFISDLLNLSNPFNWQLKVLSTSM